MNGQKMDVIVTVAPVVMFIMAVLLNQIISMFFCRNFYKNNRIQVEISSFQNVEISREIIFNLLLS